MGEGMRFRSGDSAHAISMREIDAQRTCKARNATALESASLRLLLALLLALLLLLLLLALLRRPSVADNPPASITRSSKLVVSSGELGISRELGQ